MLDHLPLKTAYPRLGMATLKQVPEDFQVDEIASFEPVGSGEHVYLQIQKRQTNTDWLARQISTLADIPLRDVGYAGLKDRQALTTQWFSALVPATREPDWSALEGEEIRILRVTRHSRKLKIGAHRGNRFSLLLRDVEAQPDSIQQRLLDIRQTGVPNYFAAQRFGRNGQNLQKADALLRGDLRIRDRKKRGLYLSAARSQIFNEVLSARVADGNWHQALPGDCLLLDGSNSFFSIEQVDDEIRRRVAEMDIHPSGPLPGGTTPQTLQAAADYELSVYEKYSHWFDGFNRAGLREQRRALRLVVAGLESEQQPDGLRLSFELPTGAYATTVVGELFTTS